MPSQLFSATGSEQTFVVPAGVTSLIVDLAGAGGGSSTGTAALPARGGRVRATLTVTPGETLRIGVGVKGVDGVSGTPGAGSFYQGASASTNNINYGGGGGGQTYLKRGGTADSNRVVVAAGGGGVGGHAADNTRHGGIVFDTEAIASTLATAGAAGVNCGGGGGGWRGGFGGVDGGGISRHGYGGANMAHSTQTSDVTSTSGYQSGDGYALLIWAGGTTAQRFYTRNVVDDQTFTSEGSIRLLDEGPPTDNVSNSITWTTTTVTEKTYIPGTNHSTAGDTSMNNGFAFNNGGLNGLGSTASAKRWIKAGVWTFSAGFTVNSPALLDTHAITVTAKVYRVASGGGSRTLLFTATSANQTDGGGAFTWNSASQPEYILEAGEVLMVGWTVTTASTTALILGANTNTVINFFRDNSGTWVQVPAPGIRTLGIGGFTASGLGAAAAIGMSRFAGVFAAAASAATNWIQTNLFSGVVTAAGAATAQAAGASTGAGVFVSDGIASAAAIGNAIFSSTFAAAGAATTDWRQTGLFSGVFTAQGTAAAATIGSAIGSGVFAGSGITSSNWQMSAVAGTVFSAAGEAASDWRVTNLFSAVFAATGSSTTGFEATAIFSGVFNADGLSDTAAVGTAVFSGVFDAAGAATADYRGSSVSGAIFLGEGLATSNWRTSKVLGATFEANVSEGGSSEYPDGLLRLRPDGRIESVNANVGALPPGALRITTVP